MLGKCCDSPAFAWHARRFPVYVFSARNDFASTVVYHPLTLSLCVCVCLCLLVSVSVVCVSASVYLLRYLPFRVVQRKDRASLEKSRKVGKRFPGSGAFVLRSSSRSFSEWVDEVGVCVGGWRTVPGWLYLQGCGWGRHVYPYNGTWLQGGWCGCQVAHFGRRNPACQPSPASQGESLSSIAP